MRQKVKVLLTVANNLKRSSLRFITLQSIFLQLLEEIKTQQLMSHERIEHWENRRRGIDNVIRDRYDWSQSYKTPQRNNAISSQVLPPNASEHSPETVEERAMGDEEE